MTSGITGSYVIGEYWDLFTGGKLRSHYVAVINVSPRGKGYRVKHFEADGGLLTSVSLDMDDVAPLLRGRERHRSLEDAFDAFHSRTDPEFAMFGGRR